MRPLKDGKRWSNATALAVAVVAAIAIGLAHRAGLWSFGGVKASEYFSDPLVIRLAKAVAEGDAEKIDASVMQGADVNATGKKGYSLLTWAMLNSNPRGFEILLDHGADPFRPAWDRPQSHSVSEKPPFVAKLCVGAKRSDNLQALLRRGMDANHPQGFL